MEQEHLFEKRIASLVEKSNTRIFSELEAIKEALTNLSSQINAIKTAMQSKAELKNSNITENSNIPRNSQNSKPSISVGFQSRGSQAYAPEDVAVEKIFYCGKRE